MSIPNFWDDSAVTDEGYCPNCVKADERERMDSEGVPIKFCNKTCKRDYAYDMQN